PKEGYHYFMISRPAPSLKEKRTNIAGRFKLGEPHGFDFYEEIFRMYKMEEQERKEKGLFLFKLMLEKADLTPYWGVNHKDEYIEFPDPHNYFDLQERRWKRRSNTEEGDIN
ncbi:MAG: hypothetical protein NZ521_09955, partial [Flammeovirgaceae bacterium]|nr:hypothetical protein [Flammeovirgaceae bacterium]MDW8288556.1 hypothetical protein [Flammeovirgaceae bacterium]